MENIVVIGGGGHAKVLTGILLKNKDYHVIGYTDITDRGELLGIRYLGTDEILGEILRKNLCRNAVLGVGQIELNTRRTDIAERLLDMGFVFPAIVSKDAIVNQEVSVGKGAVIFDRAVINSGTAIGDFSIVNTGAIVEHDCLIESFTHISPGAVLSGGVTVRKHSMIGAGAVVIQGREIASDCLVAAGAVVTKNCTEAGVYAGVPAKNLGETR